MRSGLEDPRPGSLRRRRSPRRLASRALAALFLVSCGGTGPHTLSWPADRTVAVSRGERIRNWPQAVSAIVEVMQGPMGLPPVEFSVSFFPTRSAFEEGLVAEGYPPAFAARTAAALDGVGIPGRVLLNERSLVRVAWADRVAMLSHELAHVLQYELARGRRGTSEQWLREGFAEWVSGRVLEELQLSGAGAKRGRALRAVAVAGPSRLPVLAELATWDQWVDLRTTNPRLPVYPYAFLAADLLVDRHGVDATLDYFRRFAVSNDAEGAFRFAFGETRGEFEAEFRAGLGE